MCSAVMGKKMNGLEEMEIRTAFQGMLALGRLCCSICTRTKWWYAIRVCVFVRCIRAVHGGLCMRLHVAHAYIVMTAGQS